MSKARRQAKAKGELLPEDKKARDIRRGFVFAHVVLSGLLIVGAELAWYTLSYGDRLSFTVRPLAGVAQHPAAMPFLEQARAFIFCAVLSFFFTSYDLVADADIQWPSLVISAFAFGCTGQVAYRLHDGFEHMVEGAMALEAMQKIHDEHAARERQGLPPIDTAAVASALDMAPVQTSTSGPVATPIDPEVARRIAPVGSSATASVTSAPAATPPAEDPPVKLQVDVGLKLCLFASASMTVISIYLTFFARRAP